MTFPAAWNVIVLVVLSFCKVSTSLQNIVLGIEPKIVERGGSSTLSCSYDLGDSQLYTVKWYRGQHEFYRYTPSEHPSTKTFPFKGVNVDIDLELSNEHQVVLRNLDFQLSGKFSCEVTTEAPIQTLKADNHMSVVVLPDHPPLLTTDKPYYVIGDVLKANCTSSPSWPPSVLSFIMNDIVVCEKCELRKNKANELAWSEITLELPLFPSHFLTGRLMLRCVAHISDFYQQHTERRLDNAKDPVPERVTLPHNGALKTRPKLAPFGAVLLLYLIYR